MNEVARIGPSSGGGRLTFGGGQLAHLGDAGMRIWPGDARHALAGGRGLGTLADGRVAAMGSDGVVASLVVVGANGAAATWPALLAGPRWWRLLAQPDDADRLWVAVPGAAVVLVQFQLALLAGKLSMEQRARAPANVLPSLVVLDGAVMGFDAGELRRLAGRERAAIALDAERPPTHVVAAGGGLWLAVGGELERWELSGERAGVIAGRGLVHSLAAAGDVVGALRVVDVDVDQDGTAAVAWTIELYGSDGALRGRITPEWQPQHDDGAEVHFALSPQRVALAGPDQVWCWEHDGRPVAL